MHSGAAPQALRPPEAAGSGHAPSARVSRLLERWRPTGRERTWRANGADERAVLLWQYSRSHEEEPVALRRAHGLAHVLAEIRIAIHDDELLVGEVGLEDVALTRPDEWLAASDYWRAHAGDFERSLPTYADAQRAHAHALSWKWYNRDGHAIPDFEHVLQVGLDGLREDASCARGAYHHQQADAADRDTNWQAMIAALGALAAYIRRYAALARSQAEREARPERAQELAQIAATCDWLAHGPARTLHEALQLIWFVHLGTKLDDGGVGHSFGRFDQYLLPFYRRDVAEGRLTPDGARELLALFWIKLNRECDDIAHLSLGGQTATGDDATNDLSYLCLQVERWVGRKQPNLSTRVHRGTPATYWRELARTMRCAAGHPAIFNDGVIVPGLCDYGLPVEVAREYAQVGCVETFLPGVAAPWTDCYLNLAKCLELALNNGVCLLCGERLGPTTGDSRSFETFEALFAAYEQQVERALVAMLTAKDDYDEQVSEHLPEPLNSAFIRDCLARGLDASGGGARYLMTGAYGVGLGTTVDSLAAIRTLVYEEGQLTLAALLAALRADFDGHQRVQALLRDRAPKYGNDDARVDEIATRAIASFGRQVHAYPARHPWAIHTAMLGSVTSHTTMGLHTAASANGRRARATLSDGGSPSQGAGARGATAALRSLSRADYRLVPGGAAINLRLSPGDLAGERGLDALVSLLKSYVELGGEQLQVTVVDAAVLRQALAEPERYHDLVVRVAGFTAYFVTLNEALQQEIIARDDARL